MFVEKVRKKRPHLHELDPIRVCTALGVVAVHACAFTAFLNSSQTGFLIQNAVVVTFHFTREVFLFVSAFTLVYVYNGRQMNIVSFWKKRALGILFPYCLWSVVYVLVNTHFTSPGAFIGTSLLAILTGSASYQLYYILLTVQFYLIFPFFLLFMQACARRPWLTLAVSFTLQILLFSLDYHLIQNSNQPFWQTVAAYQNRFFLVYQFYLVLGALTAFYFQQVRAFVLRHGKLITAGILIAVVILWVHFGMQVLVYREGVTYASSVLQPIMVFYSVIVIVFALWLSWRWVEKGRLAGAPRGSRLWTILAEASFGVYLVHALILTAVLRWLVPAMPVSWFEPVRVLLVWLVTAGSALAISTALAHIPVISRLVGRAVPLPGRSVPQNSNTTTWQTAARQEAPAGESQRIPSPRPVEYYERSSQ